MFQLARLLSVVGLHCRKKWVLNSYLPFLYLLCDKTHHLQDRDESTLELSLFAEGFQDMLARDYGERILKSLYAERWVTLLV